MVKNIGSLNVRQLVILSPFHAKKNREDEKDNELIRSSLTLQ